MFESTSPAKRFSYKVSKNKHTTDNDKKTNKYTHRLRYTWRTLLKLANTKTEHEGTQNRYEQTSGMFGGYNPITSTAT